MVSRPVRKGPQTAKVLLYFALITPAVVLGSGCFGRSNSPAPVDELVEETVPPTTKAGVSDTESDADTTVATPPEVGFRNASPEERAAMAEAVASVRAGSPEGFAPDVYTRVEDPEDVLPAGATVRIVAGTERIDGNTAIVDANVSIPNKPDRRYWLFLERRETVWLIVNTIELSA